MRKLIVAALFAILAAPAALASSEVTPPTPTEQAAEACEQPEIVAEFGHGSVDYCYEAMLDEINPGPQRYLQIFEDGSGVLSIADGTERSYPSDTFTWDCATMGNRICGPVPQELPELPRTS